MDSTATTPRPLPWRSAVLAAAVAVPTVVVAFLPRIVRDGAHHHYADQRTWLGIPHAGDVLSNLPFLGVGIAGLLAARRVRGLPRGVVVALFASVLAIGLGSAAFHYAPSNATLLVDWLPIALTASLTVALLAHDRLDPAIARVASIALPAAAVASIGWWWETGDARWYGLVQLACIALVPLILALYPRGRLDRAWLLAGVACFLTARLAHTRDAALLDATGLLSGHSAKHLLAAGATWCLLRALTTHAAGRR